uniref:Methyltransferase FkbM domain-containing protein n=1 Tax=Calcidiscus leptoporus TaxID=127549 RepID=A0A7S0NZ48_9EUKA
MACAADRSFSWEPAHYAHLGPLNNGGHPFVDGLLGPIARSAEAKEALVVDVGANRGKVALLLARAFPKAPLHLFDCVSEHTEYLRGTLFAADRWHGRVQVHHAVVSDKPGETVPIKGPPAGWMADPQRRASLQTAGLLGGPFSWGRRQSPAALLEKGTHVLERVVSTTLDAQFGVGRRIAFLKIDAEGVDGRVLRGAHGLLHKRQVLAVYWESFPQQQQQLNDSLASDVEWLRGRGYRSFLVGKSKLLPLTPLCRTSVVFASSQVMNAIAFADVELERQVLRSYKALTKPRDLRLASGIEKAA